MWAGLPQPVPARARRSACDRVVDESIRSVTGYMLGNGLTSVIAGVISGVTLGHPRACPSRSCSASSSPWSTCCRWSAACWPACPWWSSPPSTRSRPGIVMLVVFLVYQQVENHVLNPVIMSRTVRLNPFWVLIAVLVGATLGGRVAGGLGTFVGRAGRHPGRRGAIQVIVRELRRGPMPSSTVRDGPARAVTGRHLTAPVPGRRPEARRSPGQGGPGPAAAPTGAESGRQPPRMPSCDRWWSSRPTTSRRTSSGCCTGSTSACPAPACWWSTTGAPTARPTSCKAVAAELPDVHLLARARASPGWAAPTGPASPGASSAATTPSSRSTPTSRTTPPRCRRWWRRSSEGFDVVHRLALRRGRLHPELGLAPPPAVARRQPSTPRRCSGSAWPTRRRGTAPTRPAILRQLDLDRIRAEGYGFQIEMTYRAKQHGARHHRGADQLRRPGGRRVEDVLVHRGRGARPGHLVGPGPAGPRAAPRSGRTAGSGGPASAGRRSGPGAGGGRGAAGDDVDGRRRPLAGAEDPVRSTMTRRAARRGRVA